MELNANLHVLDFIRLLLRFHQFRQTPIFILFILFTRLPFSWCVHTAYVYCMNKMYLIQCCFIIIYCIIAGETLFEATSMGYEILSTISCFLFLRLLIIARVDILVYVKMSDFLCHKEAFRHLLQAEVGLIFTSRFNTVKQLFLLTQVRERGFSFPFFIALP